MTVDSARFYVGVDVGTASARAAVFDAEGCRTGFGSHPIQIWRPAEDFVEQSTADIWSAVAAAVRAARAEAGICASAVGGLGFDATCSLGVVDRHGNPVTVSPEGDDARNVIVWMDHRAQDQASRINADDHRVLQYVGGVISPEMQTPKLLWLRENLPESWRRAGRFFDLADWLSFRATGIDARSLCTTACKWTYLGHEAGIDPDDTSPTAGTEGWDRGYFEQVGLEDLVAEGFARIGTRIRPLGARAGELTLDAAADLGLEAGTPVAVAAIDAHAGGLGLFGAGLDAGLGDERTIDLSHFEERLALITGTSSCHMAVSAEPRFVDGVWGPYWSAMVPGLWLTEGGQSATGALVDHVISSHARGAELTQAAERANATVYDLLNERLAAMAVDRAFPAELTADLHVLPYFRGNRSPRADAGLRGMISGLALDDGIDALARTYMATVQAIAYGTRHIIDVLNDAGWRIAALVACGGGTKNGLFLREHADATGCRVVLPHESEAVLLGSAMLAATAAGGQPSLAAAMRSMSAAGRVIEPSTGPVAGFHDRKYRVFHRMCADQRAYRDLMQGAASVDARKP